MAKKQNKGITLIALVITIIVLLILAAISIATLTGPSGLLTKANDAKKQTEVGNLKEMVQTDILGYQVENENGKITSKQLRDVLDKYFKRVPEKAEDLEKELINPDYTLEAKDEYGKDVNLKVSDLYKGEIETGSKEDTKPDAKLDVSYVGYYADFQNENGELGADGKVDGIIYADLAKGANRKME